MLSRALCLLTLTVCSAEHFTSHPAHAGDDPFADEVIWYEAGSGAAPGYGNSAVALGAPERTSGECFDGLDAVTAFSSAYCFDEIVSIGSGGQLVLKFDTPVTNNPNNLYGIDLLVFGNASFIDAAHPAGLVSGLFNEGGLIEVSADGKDWRPIAAVEADGPWPTVGYSDVEPYAHTPGLAPTDFTRPVDPALTLNDFLGLSNPQIISLYRGSGGGAGVDIDSTGLAEVTFIRLSLPVGQVGNIEIDAVADVGPRLPGDVNLDGEVNVTDLLLVINAWGPAIPGGMPADFNLDQEVSVDDLLVVINHWGS